MDCRIKHPSVSFFDIYTVGIDEWNIKLSSVIRFLVDGHPYFDFLNSDLRYVSFITHNAVGKIVQLHPLDLPNIDVEKYLLENEIVLNMKNQYGADYKIVLHNGRWQYATR
jgi:hypothetical protein